MSGAVLEAVGIRKSYVLPHGRIDVLRGANLTVGAGETVAITGRSGAGKSTLLNVLGGLDAPDAGEVRFQGAPFSSLSEARRTALRATGVGFVFQSYQLLPEMTILENAMLPAMAAGRLGRAEMRARAADLLARAGLSHRLAHHPAELSGGEQQRVALARALMCAPEVVLADEPTGNLDKLTGAEIMKLLFEVSETPFALVMVTHSAEAAALCDRVLTLDGGRLV